MILELDAFFLNEDRHTHNIALILDKNHQFTYCPIFDNGSSLFSDTTLCYDLNTPLDTCYQNVQAKPFHISFDLQMDAAESLYGSFRSIKKQNNIITSPCDLLLYTLTSLYHVLA